MEWSEFGSRLSRVLREAVVSGHESILIVSKSGDDSIYVQFALDVDGVVSEISSSPRHLPRHLRLGRDAEKLLKEAGWLKPSRRRSPNWSTMLWAPAEPAEYDSLAARCVAVLREVFAITAPPQLVYDAFAADGMPLELNELGLARH